MPDNTINYAPVLPLIKAKDTETPSSTYVSDALRAKYKGLMAQDKRTWREMMGVGQLIALFIEGKQRLFFNPFSKTYAPIELKAHEAQKPRAMSVMQFYSTKHSQQWLGSNPNIQIVPQGDDDRIISAAKGADIMLEHYERKFYTTHFNQQEALLVQCFGTNINRVRFDPGAQGGKVLREIIENQEIELGEGYGECECGKTGTAKEFPGIEIAEGLSMPVCSSCGSMAVHVEPAEKQVLPMVTGSEPVPYGDITIEVVPFPATRWDLRCQIEDSSWAIIEKVTNLGAVQLALGKLKLKERDKENPGLDIMDAITQIGTPVGGDSSTGLNNTRDGRSQHEVVATEMFLSAADLHDIKTRQDEKTVSGQILPKDTPFSELFPDGACICGLNGLDIITGIYPESHKKQLTSGVYHAKPLSGVGRGLADMIETQKRINATDNQILDYHQSLATPAMLYAKGSIKMDEARYLGSPKLNIPVDLRHFPEMKSLDQLVKPLQPQSAGALFYEYSYNTLTNFMQLQSHVTEFGEALAGMKGQTATAANLSASLAQSLFAPLLAGKVNCRIGNARNIVHAFTSHFPFPKHFSSQFKGKNRQSKGKWFKGADIEGDFEFFVEKDSEVPRNQFTKRQEMMEMFTGVFGGYQNYQMAKQTDPEEVNAILRAYNIDLEADTSDVIAEICRERIDNAFVLADQMLGLLSQTFGDEAAAYFDPNTVISGLTPAIEQFELEHEAQLKWYASYFHTDEGRELDPPKRGVVNALIATHFSMAQGQQTALAQAAAMVQLAGQQPLMEAELANQEAQGQMQIEQGQAQMAMEGEKMAMGQAQAEQDLENQANQEIIKSGGQMLRDTHKIATDKERQKMKMEKAA